MNIKKCMCMTNLEFENIIGNIMKERNINKFILIYGDDYFTVCVQDGNGDDKEYIYGSDLLPDLSKHLNIEIDMYIPMEDGMYILFQD